LRIKAELIKTECLTSTRREQDLSKDECDL